MSQLIKHGVGDSDWKKIFFKSVDFSIKVAKRFKYEWPIFYNIDTLDILKKEAKPGEGGEKDVPGMYAYLMLRAYEHSKQKKYLNEAIRAVRKFDSYDHNVLYQTNNTCFAAEALLELWTLTKNEKYIALSILLLSHILRNTSLWERTYGNSKEYQSFFALYPLKDAPYSAVFEEHECLTSIHRYLKMAYLHQAPLSQEIQALLPEYVKYACQRIPFYYPPLLPSDIIAEEVKTGYLDTQLWMPVEDLGDGWEPIGQVGQEVYGAGALFNLVMLHIYELQENVASVFIEYPTIKVARQKRSISFLLTGLPAYTCQISLIHTGTNEFKVEINGNKSSAKLSSKHKTLKVNGGDRISISW